MRKLLRMAIYQHADMKRTIGYNSTNGSIETIPLRAAGRGRWIHDSMYYSNNRTSISTYSYRHSRRTINTIRSLDTETYRNPSLRGIPVNG